MTGRNRKKSERDPPLDTDCESEVDEQSQANPPTHHWEKTLNAILLDENKKIAKPTGAKINEIFYKLQEENNLLKLRIAYLEGRLDERNSIEEKVEAIATRKETYAEKIKKVAAPKVGKKPIITKVKENTVLLYPENPDGNGTSDRTKSAIKKVLVPQKDNLQIKKIIPITKGGIIIQTGSAKTASVIREAAKKAHGIKCVENKIKRPRLQIFDVESEMSEEAFLQHLYTQNLQDAGVDEKEMRENVKVCFKYGKKDEEFCKLVIECSPKIREHLIRMGRIYIEYASCKVSDYLVVTRCYQCQQYGHLSKYCKAKTPTCSRCGEDGHNHKECRQPKEVEVCANCRTAKKDSKHRVGTMKCPIYARAVERLVGSIQYNSK